MNRYYSAGYGRFLTVDRFGASARAGNPTSWNRYIYSLGDPINGHDPSGLCSSDSGGDDYVGSCYCPPEQQYCNQGPPGTDYGINDPSQGNCGTTTGFVDGDDDANNTVNDGSGCVTPSPPPAPPAPSCTLTAEYRYVWHTPGNHSYLDFQLPGVPADDGIIIEGVPTGGNIFKRAFGFWGNLYGVISGVNGSAYSQDDPSEDTVIGSDSGPGVCEDLGILEAIVLSYDTSGAYKAVKYLPVPFGSARNSNSFTFTLLNDLGLYVSNPGGGWGGWLPGWGKVVPFLNPWLQP